MQIPTVGSNGFVMPKLGLGTYGMAGEACTASVARAIGLGFRHIDTAEIYGNEKAVGRGIAQSRVPREDVFITTKVWCDHLSPDGIRRALRQSLDKLGTSYVDLYLIHWPSSSMNLSAVLETMAHLADEGLVRQFGASNFTVALMRQVVETLGAAIVCNQIEYHVLLDQSAVLEYARQHGIVVTAYCRFACGRLAQHKALQKIAERHGATPAQVALKWLLDHENVAAIPRAASEQSQRASLASLDIVLDDEDRAAIAALPKAERCVDPLLAPEWD